MKKEDMRKINNKDYILNIRVSRETYDKIKMKALENKENVSQYVRKIVEDSKEIFSDLSCELLGKDKEEKNEEDNIVLYYDATAGKDAKCSQCDAKVKEGETVKVGETKSGRKILFCPACEK